MSTLILRTAARVVNPVALVLSAYLLLRGHSAPGGGFIAALVAGAALVLQYLAFGIGGVRRFLPISASALAGSGLALAAGYGVAGLVVGGDFLQGTVLRWEVPVIGEIKVAASLLFDAGVYLVVLAIVVTMVRYLGEDPE